MKLLPLTLTLFDKVTNNTYKGTVLLKNLDSPGPGENASNATGAGLDEEAYDGKGAGLFIILVISVYALSIVLFIASFITKKTGVGESLNEESTVTTYLHKVGDLKEKTAREHFKKLKMSIISKVEADSQNQRSRGRKGSRGAKELASVSRASSKTSLGEGKVHVERPKSINGKQEPIPSTGLLPKEDDARQPLLGSDNSETPTPPVRDTLSPNFEPWGPYGRTGSPALRRASSPRTLSIIKEQDNEQDSDGSRKRHSLGNGTLKRKAGGSVDSLRAKSVDRSLGSPEPFSTEEVSDVDGEAGSDSDSDDEMVSHRVAFSPRLVESAPTSQAGSLERLRKPDMAQTLPKQYVYTPDPHIERPRPKHKVPNAESYEDVWEQMPQKLMPPPKQKSNRNPKNLYVQIPQSVLNSSDVWVLRNSNRRAVFLREPSPPEGREDDPRQVIQQQGHGSPAPQRPTTLDTGKLRRERSLRDHSQREMSPPDSRTMHLTPQENLNLPRPFRTPSPRTPTEQYLPRSARDGGGHPVGPDGSRDKDKAVVKITLDRSPDHLSPQTGVQGWANVAYDQSPRPGSQRSDRRERTPPKFTFTEGAPSLDVPQPQFPVTFNSPGLPRRKEEKL